MGKRKVFNRTDLSVPHVEHSRDAAGRVVIIPEAIPPATTTVAFGRNATRSRGIDFAPWYGTGIDPITYACQRQIERFLARRPQAGRCHEEQLLPTAEHDGFYYCLLEKRA